MQLPRRNLAAHVCQGLALRLLALWEGGAAMSSDDFENVACTIQDSLAEINQTLKQIALYLRLLSGAKE